MAKVISAEDNPFFEKPKSDKQNSWLVDILQSVVIAIFVCIVIYLFIATPNQVSGVSMEDNFHDGELLLTNKITQYLGNTEFGQSLGLEYQQGDVIVFQKPGQRDLIKRIIGMPGDNITIQEGDVYLNGKKVVEKYLPPERRTISGSFAREGETIEVGEGEYFVMGDNRSHSQDSRFVEIGLVKREWMKGRVILRYWPLSVFGIIPTGEVEVAE